MGARQAFQIFIRHQLEVMKDDGKINLTAEELEKFANGVENDFTFYEQLADFLEEYINDFGENYGI